MDNYQKDVLNLCRYLYYMHAECNNQAFCWFYLQNEACFYECDPILGHFQPTGTETLDSVPVCASYCNSWFDACRNDTTCTDNWLLLYLNTSVDTCPQSECRTFEEWFGNGRDFCNTIWDTSYTSTLSRRTTVPYLHLTLVCPTPIPSSHSRSVMEQRGN